MPRSFLDAAIPRTILSSTTAECCCLIAVGLFAKSGGSTATRPTLTQRWRRRPELDAVSVGLHLVVAKSLGTFALPLAVERTLPGVWLTPILTEASIATAVRNLSAPSLLVGGTEDRLWDAEFARQSAAEVLELEGANHSLEFGESVEPSLAALQQVVARVATFVDRLGH